MAINEKEITLSNKSYVKKDFASIYPEQVEFVQKITNRWDPQTSNESDPGVVLLKENSFIGDKLNYNIDKNILEAFMPSCTQETSMRMNCESRGYEMRYYVAPKVEITFTYTGDAFDNGATTIYLPKYDTIITSEDNSVYYVLLENVELKSKGAVSKVNAIQGDLEYLTVSGATNETKIQLDNLDDNNRIYFNVTNVAQNGVIIYNDGGEQWEAVKNLNTVQSGMKVYKFGYDSRRGLPYVEFSSDIAALIGDGFYIRYIITAGKNGNVRANLLTKIASTHAYKDGEAYELSQDGEIPEITIKNNSASINGADPETIDEAYSNFKRTIGTFDTLVTCRDYANAVYNLYDKSNSNPVVSNIQVADRRDDINHSVKVSSFDTYGPRMVNYDSSQGNVKAFDLYLYPLTPITSYTLTNYEDSFKRLVGTTYIEEELEDSQCLSHDYKTPTSNDIYAIKNIAKLDARIVTTYKVNNYERATIIANIQEALIENFNAREIDYGYEIPYDTILNVIQNADSRISSVSLSEPELKTSYMLGSGVEVSQESYHASDMTKNGVGYFTLVLAKNILNGKISLFDYDSDFNYDFAQVAIPSKLMKLKKIASIDTSVSITLTNATQSSALKSNEVIQLIGPNIVTDVPYGAYVFYRYSGASVPDGTNHKLGSGEFIQMYYTDADGNVQYPIITDTIIQPTGMTLTTTTQSQGGGRVKKTIDGLDYWFDTIGAKANINTREINKTRLGSGYNCYWIRNNANNELFTNSDYSAGTAEIILGDGEYFFYTDEGFNTLVTVGSGTTLKTNHNNSDGYFVAKTIEYSEIAEKGLDALSSYWKYIDLTKDARPSDGTYIDMVENNILTLVEGDDIKLTGLSSSLTLTNTMQELASGVVIEYHSGGNYGKLEGYSGISDAKWRIKSRLDINAGKDVTQILKSGQTIKFKAYNYNASDSSTYVLLDTANQCFNLNVDTQIAGGSNIDVRIYNYVERDYEYPLSVYDYTLDTTKPDRNSADYWTINNFHGTDSKALYLPAISGENAVLAIYYIPDSSSGGAISISRTGGSGDLSFFNGTHSGTLLSGGSFSSVSTYTAGKQYFYKSGDDYIKDNLIVDAETFATELAAKTTLYTYSGIHEQGLYIIAIPNTVTQITISAVNHVGSGNIVIDYPKYYNGNLNVQSSYSGYNKNLGIDELKKNITNAGGTVSVDNIVGSLMNYLKTLGSNVFYYTETIDSSKIIETKDMSSPYALYDYNNVANKFVITQIDIINSDIDVVRSSRI